MSAATPPPPDARPVPAWRRLLPRPWTALWLWLAWLLLNQTLAPGHLLLGFVLAAALAPFAPRGPQAPGVVGIGPWRRAGLAMRLAGTVLLDIVTANLQVAMLILGGRAAPRSRFVWVPLDVERPRSIALLAAIVTMTPGTVSAELSDDRRHLLVHALDVDDAGALVDQVKTRYEARIKEILG